MPNLSEFKTHTNTQTQSSYGDTSQSHFYYLKVNGYLCSLIPVPGVSYYILFLLFNKSYNKGKQEYRMGIIGRGCVKL